MRIHKRILNFLSSFSSDDRAGIMTMTAVTMPMLLGFAGLGIDVTSWYMIRRTAQSLVDTAAVEGAHHVINYPVDEMQGLLKQFVMNNGYDPARDEIEINSPPLNGINAGTDGFVEVIHDRQATMYFLSAFYALFSGEEFSVKVQSRGVAGSLVIGEACVVSLSPNDNRALNFSGTTTVTSDCGIASNSTSESAIQIGGNATVQVTSATTVGNFRQIGGGTVSDSDGDNLVPQTLSNPIEDPYLDLEAPLPTSPCTYTANPSSQPVDVSDVGVPTFESDGVTIDYYTLSPGTYCSGLRVQHNTFFSPGLYLIHNGDFNANAGVSMWGDNITFFLTGDSDNQVGGVRDNGQVSLDFSATTSGEYEGILLFQALRDPEGQAVSFNGGATMSLDGVVYVPSSHLKLNGGTSAAPTCLKLYGHTVEFSGNSHVGNDETVCDSIGLTATGDAGLTRVQLVE